MADSRRYPLQTHLDIGQIVQDAQIRWLRPNEICEIIRNYLQFQLTPDPPFRPRGGSLFLFDRKALRYFRKDGHNWRKKKDGKTVREAHEKLKCGSIDVLHCYYAHGENNENFQRRSYWMLDGKLEHIVLVHYRDVHDANKPSVARVLSTSRDQKRLTPPSVQSEPCTSAQANSNPNPNPNTCGFEEDSAEDVGGPFTSVCEDIPFMSSDSSSSSSMLVNHFSLQDFILSSGQHMILSPTAPNNEAQSLLVKSEWPNFLMPQPNIMSFQIQKGDHHHLTPPPPPPPPPPHPVFIGDTDRRDQMRKEQMGNEAEQPPTEIHFDTSYEFKGPISCDTSYEIKGPISCDTSCEFKTQAGLSSCDEMDNDDRALQKMDSFGRWMNSEMGRDCDDSLMAATASESCDYWNALDDTKEVISRHIMQLDSDVCPSLSQEQLFTIIDFSPDWSYSSDATQETRVLISGKFLGSFDPQTIRWGCMFGEKEVPAEVLTSSGGALRCVVPPVTSPGRVPFYITRSNRLACSEIREFEFRAVPPKIEIENETQEEFQLQVRLAKLLSAEKWPVCSVASCSKCEMKRNSSEVVVTGLDGREGLIGRLMKDRLLEWLSYKLHKEEQDGTRENILDEGGQGVIHLVAALGYDWAMGPIVKSGLSPSFRDARGWTALHWAAYYGREDTVATLVKLGSDPAAVEDPTSKCPIGCTAADVASSRGYKGIAGFLAEAHLTSHLSSLTIHVKEDDLPQDDDDNDALNLVSEQTGAGGDDQYEDDISIKRSLEALRNSAQAAARIRAAFRVNSFRLRQTREKEERGGKDDVDVLLDHVAMALSSSSSSSSSCSSYRLKMNNNTQIGGEREPLHCLAALKIQRKYRGWKGRRDYLKIRNKIVKIQAHVRGHQVRKQYKKVVWSVSIVEKAILRWRRKGSGLRGFRSRAPQVMIDDEYDYLSLGRRQKELGLDKALATVRSMARSPQARHQYMRLLFTSHQI